MEFDLSDDQRLLVDTVDRVLVDADATRLARAFADGTASDESALFAKLASIGLAGILVAEGYGGGDRGLLDLALVCELIGYHAAPGPFLEHVVATAAIAWGGSDDQKARWLPDLAEGRLRTTFAPISAGRWLGSDSSPAVAVSGDPPSFDWVLHPRGADLAVVHNGRGLAIVDLRDALPKIEDIEALDRTRRLGRVTLDGVDFDPLDGGAALVSQVRDATLVLVAADAIGGARRCVDLTAAYVNEREQFGVTIAHFQGVKHQFAEMAVEVEPARFLVWYAAHVHDKGEPSAGRTAAITKAHACDRFVAAARSAVELHGGIGYTWECDVQLFLKRAVFDRAYLGSPSLHRRRAADLAGWTTPQHQEEEPRAR